MEYYRVRDSKTAVFPPRFFVDIFAVVGKTRYGVWLDVYGQRRLCFPTARKKFACPTVQGAMESYLARKRKQREILAHQLAFVDRAIEDVLASLRPVDAGESRDITGISVIEIRA
jgi:hypothetical protein